MFIYIHAMGQALLFGRETVSIDRGFRSARRSELGRGAWIEHQSGWLNGHLEVFEALRDKLRWRAQRRQMYEREIDVPRLLSGWPNPAAGAPSCAHPIIDRAVEALSERYGRDLSAVALAYYRDGSDSVAPHGDRMGSMTDDCVIAIVAVGERRTFHLRPAMTGAPNALRYTFELGWGDLPANDVVFDYLAEAVTVTGTLYETQLGLELRLSPGSIIRR
ncbi:MAG: alpha-ketoglutarate-dependent dioxygenase AlkB [Myxococcota bacterium]